MTGTGQGGDNSAAGRFRPGKWGWLLIIVGALALISITPIGHIAAVLAMISVIGIPLYFLLAALPSLFLILLFFRFVFGAIDGYRAGRAALAIALGAAALFMLDYFVLRAHRANANLDTRAQALIAGDIATTVAIPNGRTLAAVRTAQTARRADLENVCDDLCQRVLLNGFAKRFIAVTQSPSTSRRKARGTTAVSPALEPSDEMQGIAYWLEPRPSCPAMNVPDNVRLLRVDASVNGAGRMSTRAASEAMRLKIASGVCLMSAPARLADADDVFFYGQIARGPGLVYGFDVSANTVSAWRVAYFRRDGAVWTPEYRATGVRYLRFPIALIPGYIHGSQLQLHNGYLRIERLLGARERRESEPPVAETLANLGVNLRIEDAGRTDGPRAVDEALASKGELSSINVNIIDDYLGRLSANRSRQIEPADARRVLALAADPRVKFTYQAQGAVTMIVQQQPQLTAGIARTLFDRLNAIMASASIISNDAVRQTGTVSNALAAMPASALKPYFANIEAVAGYAGLRAAAQNLIARLDVFGSFAVPLMFKVMDDSLAQRAPQASSNWRAGITAGMRALCRLGGEAAFARPMLAERIQRDGQYFVAANDSLLIATLARMGASESEIADLLGFDETKKNRMRSARRAANGPRPCG